MGLVLAIFSGFVLGMVAPFLHRVTRGVTGWIISALPFFLLAYFASFIKVIKHGEVVSTVYNWVPGMGINLSFYIDGLGLLFAMLITGIGGFVIIYASIYLAGHIYLGRFYLFILMFMASMLGVVLSDNVITLFIFWELTGITSYFLIGFNCEREESRNAALQALLVTGIGGLALLAGFIMMGSAAGSYELSDMLNSGDLLRNHSLYIPILILVFAGAFTKSAQVPFQFWLPNAMEAPTPISAYLHSATMVKAGVFLLARLTPILGGTDVWFYTVSFTGATTMVIGGYMALHQTDLKKILAYSTVCVLGILTMLLGFGTPLAFKAAMAFLLAHALYKASLFLVAGMVDHGAGTREINKLGGLRKYMPVTAIIAGLATLSACGLPPFFGFVGKELFYETDIAVQHATYLMTGASVFANIFMFGAIWLAGVRPFICKYKELPHEPHESPFGMLFGPGVLASMGLIFGLFPGLLEKSILVPAASAVAGEHLHMHLALWHGFNLPLLLSVITVAGGFSVFTWRHNLIAIANKLSFISRFGSSLWYKKMYEWLFVIARIQTKTIQSGYQRYYLLTIFVVSTILISYKLLEIGGVHQFVNFGDIKFYEVALGVFMMVAMVTAILSDGRLTAVIALGVVGFCVSLIYVFYSAPDLALTQILIETLTVILIILVVYHLPRFAKLSSLKARIRDAVLSIAFGGVMTALVLKASNVQLYPTISDYFVENSLKLAHGRNIVNVILVDFRGFDTMGEITVLSVVGIGVYALIKLQIRPDGGVDK